MSALLILLAATASGGTERFAVIAGSNDGGPGRATLRYADSDADDVADVLSSLGGLSSENTALLLDTDPAAIDQAIRALGDQVGAARARGSRTEVFFYYSGHSDEEGLLPSGERYAYHDLRDNLDAVGADLRLVILDSCSSGAIRTKGGTVTAPFLVDGSVDVKGHAYLTSSSITEAAQESDGIEASFFTHYLTSGLRGAADMSGDGLVTLSEAYLFAKDETLARTERSLAGPQHPEWEIQLAGSGDLVVTSIDATVASLFVPEGVTGRLFVRDADGDLVAELSKPAERGVILGMAPGEYTATLVAGESISEAKLVLESGQTATLSALDFHRVQGEATVARGDAPASDEEWIRVGTDFIIVPTRTNSFEGPREIHSLGVGLVAHHADRVDGAQVALGAVVSDTEVRGAQLAIGAAFAGGGVDGGQATVGLNVAGGDLRGVQWTVGANVADGDVSGGQLSVGANFANGEVDGIQGAVGANVATGKVSGAQLSVGANYAPEVDGLQAGLVNGTDKGRGLQLGLVNVGGQVDGLQLGLVNVARDADESIALLAINGAGYNHLTATSNESDHLDLGATWGGKRLYTTVRYGLRVQESGVRHTPMIGLGLHAGNRLFVDTDVVGGTWFEDNRWSAASVIHGRVGLGVELVPGFAIFGGPTVSGIPWSDGPAPFRATGQEGNVVRPNRWGWAGLFAGIRLL